MCSKWTLPNTSPKLVVVIRKSLCGATHTTLSNETSTLLCEIPTRNGLKNELGGKREIATNHRFRCAIGRKSCKAHQIRSSNPGFLLRHSEISLRLHPEALSPAGAPRCGRPAFEAPALNAAPLSRTCPYLSFHRAQCFV